VLQPWQGCVLTADTTVAWSHRPESNRDLLPTMQTLVPSELRRRVVLTPLGLSQSLLPGSNRHPSRYRRAALIQLRQGGGAGTRRGAKPLRSSGRAVARPVRSAGFEPATSGISDRSLYQLEYEHFVTSCW
jgi:hypothetical protein